MNGGEMLSLEGVTMGVLAAALAALVWTRLNWWLYKSSIPRNKLVLPPGGLGWPLLGNMPHFLFAFKSGNPQSFIARYLSRYGRTGVYTALMFGRPTALATGGDTCRAVLMADDAMVMGWPAATCALMGRNSFTSLGRAQHRRLRHLTAANFNGPNALASFVPTLRSFVVAGLDHCASVSAASRRPIPLLPHLKKLTFLIIAKILMGFEQGERYDVLERAYKDLNVGVRAMAINFPGTAYHTALKSRKILEQLLGRAVAERRRLMADACSSSSSSSRRWNDTMEMLITTRDDDGRALSDDEIIDVLLMYLNAGHESSAHSIMWILIYLKRHPRCFDKVKEEQEQILKSKKAHEPLTYDDCRKMKYLSRVIDETLRIVNISPMVFRKSLEDVELNGYTIPKGWHVQTWLRQVHLDPELYKEPMRFDPDRWESMTLKPGMFMPFGAGAHMCPGNEFAKLEMSVFMHYAVLGYEFEPITPDAPVVYLPHPHPKDNFMVRVHKKESRGQEEKSI